MREWDSVTGDFYCGVSFCCQKTWLVSQTSSHVMFWNRFPLNVTNIWKGRGTKVPLLIMEVHWSRHNDVFSHPYTDRKITKTDINGVFVIGFINTPLNICLNNHYAKLSQQFMTGFTVLRSLSGANSPDGETGKHFAEIQAKSLQFHVQSTKRLLDKSWKNICMH